MKYYIPTSSLNIDCILQSECISPYPYYSQRKRGYDSFELLDCLRQFEHIILLSYPVKLERTDFDRYNFPILIEVDDDCQLKDITQVGDGIFACNHTIHLTPQNCRIFFFNQSEYDLTLINTKDEPYIKYFKEYKINPTADELEPRSLPEFTELQINGELAESSEDVIDQQKGILYGYLLGKYMSLDEKMARVNNLAQQIYDVVIGIKANPDMQQSLNQKLQDLLKEFQGCDKELLSSRSKPQKPLDQILKNVEDRSQEMLDNYRKTNTLNISNLKVKGAEITLDDMPLSNKVIKWLLNNNISLEALSSNKREICTKLASIVKEVKGDNTDVDELRNMYHAIDNPVHSFNIQSIKDSETKALAAFIFKGHSTDELLKFLKTKEFTDYSCVLLLWGAVVGYSEMSKFVLSPILSLDNQKKIYGILKSSSEAVPEELVMLFNDEDFNRIKEHPKSWLKQQILLLYKKFNTLCRDFMEALANIKFPEEFGKKPGKKAWENAQKRFFKQKGISANKTKKAQHQME